MWVYTIVRVFFLGDEFHSVTASDSFKVLDDAKITLLGIVRSLIDAGYEHTGGFTLNHIANTDNIDQMLAVLEYRNELYIYQIKKTWLE